MFKNMFKRWLALMMSAIVLLTGLGMDCVSVQAASYSGDYRYWSQGASDDEGMRRYGCWVVAQSKMLYEANIDRSGSFNPDTYLQWQKNNGYINSGYYQTNGGEAPVAYASQKGKTLNYLGYWDGSDSQIWFNINAGYYTILKVKDGGHYVLIANELSKEKGELYCYESYSANTSANPRLISHYSVRNGGYVYSIGGAPATPEDGTRVKNTGVTEITETTAKINAKINPGAKVSEVGFYYGKSPDNMQKVVE